MNIKREVKKDSFAVKISLEEDDKVVGWAYLYIIVQDRHSEPYGLLENVYIEKEYRGKGLGTKLVDLIIEEAKERDCYKIIGTSKHIKPEVHAFYKKHGFKDIGLEFRMDLKDSKVLTRD